MKKFSILVVMVLLFSMRSTCAYSQTYFVDFETSSGNFETCQNRPFSVIANIVLDKEDIAAVEWTGEPAIKRSTDEMAILNTGKAGQLKVKLSVTTKSGQKMDSSLVIKVKPKPQVKISIRDNQVEIDDLTHIINYKWLYNKQVCKEFENEPYKNPKDGEYKVFILDNNGCMSTSESITIGKN